MAGLRKGWATVALTEKTVAHCSLITSRRKSGGKLAQSLASVWSTALPKRLLTISSRSLQLSVAAT